MLGFMILRPKGLLDDWELADWLGRRLPGRRCGTAGPAQGQTGGGIPFADRPAASSAPVRLAAAGVTVDFGGLRVLEGAHLLAESGRVVGLIGPNGAGKTTMLNAMTGVVAPTQGRFSLDGEDLAGLEPHRLARLGLARAFQNLRLFAALTVRENIEVAALAGARSARQAERTASGLLRLCGLADIADVRACALDYGASKRLELARAAAQAPRFLLLDEPTSAFSELESVIIVDQIRRIAETVRCGVVVIDHDLAFITNLCDRVYCLDQGSVIATGSPAEIRSHPAVRAAYLGG